MTNAFQWVDSLRVDGVVKLPFGEVSSPVIDSRDIASVAAEALSSDQHAGKIYTLSGPESITPRQQVQILGEVLSGNYSFETIPDDIARENMLRRMPVPIVDAILELSRQTNFSEVLSTVKEVTGREPRTFKQWSIDYMEAFML